MTTTAFPFADTSLVHFRHAYLREHGTTRRILSAFPAEQKDFKPAERANSAQALAWTFVLEEAMLLKTIRGEQVLGSGFGKPPDSWEAVLQAFDAQHEEILAALDAVQGELTNTVKFPAGPGRMADYPAMEFAWFMLCDQIHHRGQLSVYVRIVGGKLPSIYGPSGDEPWT
ncbi:MAG TPA: DinB family protein [Thermoanaerobaculia bacterium]|nr:DinB family protein [Thermoanaerobaculia bacterium]